MDKQSPPPYTYQAPPPNPGTYPPGSYPSQPSSGIYQPPGAPHVNHSGQAPIHHIEHTVVIATAPAAYGPNPIQIGCPYCHAVITTAVETEPTTKTHLFALILCVIGCWLCCCFPYCMDSCQSKKHFCPSCKAYLGEYNN
ncbi:lipopolysaccharide-induced tumor necrosis factor-alpha factor homolog [Rhynchophorus ferrugineus]|uniref:lipopolysaccharide-induced tumor necrosis factor-alpha factor homolog n=1 Tax=Rhynchophorus ferrugineus TaxID=354439 RepID=UPI003FCD3E53